MGVPHPPPPGDLMLMVSPGWIVKLFFPGSRVSIPLEIKILSPGVPSLPPQVPGGPLTRRSLSSDTLAGTSSIKSRRRPSPPGYLPAPPEFLRIL